MRRGEEGPAAVEGDGARWGAAAGEGLALVSCCCKRGTNMRKVVRSSSCCGGGSGCVGLYGDDCGVERRAGLKGEE